MLGLNLITQHSRLKKSPLAIAIHRVVCNDIFRGVLTPLTETQIWDLFGWVEVDLFVAGIDPMSPLVLSMSPGTSGDRCFCSRPDLRLCAFLPINSIQFKFICIALFTIQSLQSLQSLQSS